METHRCYIPEYGLEYIEEGMDLLGNGPHQLTELNQKYSPMLISELYFSWRIILRTVILYDLEIDDDWYEFGNFIEWAMENDYRMDLYLWRIDEDYGFFPYNCEYREEIPGAYRDEDDRHSLLYSVWQAIKRRCFCTTDKSYPWYGGRGIVMCEEWINDYNVFRKWALAHGYEKGLSIDRIDNDGDYEPSNCQFIPRSENSRKRFWDEGYPTFVERIA